MGIVRFLGLCVRSVAVAAVVGGALAFAAVPSPYRAFTPDLYDLTEVAPDVYIDDPTAAPRVLQHIEAAKANVQAFFGPLQTDPVWVLCTTSECEARMGLSANGMTFGFHLILMGPRGVNEMIMTHERVHVELHRNLSAADILGPKYPAWFDEGLATYLSGDDRPWMPANPRESDWIREAKDFFSWVRLREGRDWRDSYGAAARLVAEIEEVAGREGLRDLIRRVGENGEDFDTVYADTMRR
ncbi:hypothetical protein [Psychromarinibacter halotolerans]|uniref:Peptidase MA superfamily protein n=1 Tax=Psychromarinibacter halotolerans TaxID=1775175 RepID=A0ABV7H1K3_9RHOB|nr:hypothetical protein [Psychromarinibacter halotolerans]MDF0598389.1 hypothetical protein [Psychromarinibacter halotolerans]